MSGIRVELELDTGEFTTRVLHAGESLQQFRNNVGANIVTMRSLNETSRSFLSTMRDVSVIVGIGGAALNSVRQITTGWIGDIVRVNAEMERLNTLMRTLSRSSDPVREAAQNVTFLRQTAQQAPFSLQALSDTFVKLKSTGIDPTAGSFKALIDGVAAFGGTEETLKRATVAISQIAGKGVVQAEELRQQLGEAIPRATELLARGLGVSYSQLVADIATGRVAATESLRALQIELTNTFGGAAQEQVNTFTGLLNIAGTSLQDFALKAGNTGFFDNLKKQLRDINSALSSNAAGVIANDLGRGLNTTVNVLRDVVDWVIKYRQELAGVAIAAATGFGGAIIIRSLAGTVSAIAGAITQFAVLRGSIQASHATLTAFTAGGTIGLTSLQTAARGLWVALIPIGGVLSAVAGWLPLVAAAAYAAASYFGLFSDKAKDAYDDAEKYGITSRKQADDAIAYVRRKEQELAEITRMRDARLRMFNNQGGRYFKGAISEAFDPEIAKREQELAEKRQNLSKQLADFEITESQRAARVQLEAINQKIQAEQRAYDNSSITLKQQLDRDRAEAASRNKSVVAIDQKYGEEQQRLSLGLLDRKIALYDDFYQELKKKAESNVAVERKAAEEQLNTIAPILSQLYDDRNYKAKQVQGSPLLTKTLDDDALYKKGQTALHNLQAEVKGLQAALSGANAEVVELNEKLKDGKYGDADVKRVQELSDALVKAQAEKQALDDLLNGKKKLDRDIQSLITKTQQEILDAQTRGLDELDKLIVAIDTGLYKLPRAGQSPLDSALDSANTKLEQAGLTASAAGSAIRDNALGPRTTAAANTFIGVIDRVDDAWSRLRKNIEGTDAGSAVQRLTASAGKAFQLWQQTLNPQSVPVFTAPGTTGKTAATGPQSNEAAAIATVNPVLQQVIELARTLSPVGFQIVEGARSAERQAELVAQGKSKTYNSQHLTGSAVDFVGVDANGKRTYDENIMLQVAEAFKEAAKRLGVAITAGADWKSFQDTPHIELARPTSPGLKTGGSVLPIPDVVTPEQKEWLEYLKKLRAILDNKKEENALDDEMKRLKASIAETGTASEGLNKNLAATEKLITMGKLGKNVDPRSDQYKELLAAARKLDEVENAAAEKKRQRTISDTATENLVRSQEDLASRSEAALRRIVDPQQLKFSDAYFRKQKELGKATDGIGNYYGFDSPQYQKALGDAAAQLHTFRNLEVQEAVASYAQQNQELERSLQTESQARDDELRKEIDRARKILAEYTGTGEDRVQVEAAVTRRIALLQQKAAQAGPFAQQLKQWRDLWGNFEQSAANALSSVTDQIAEFVTTGKADFASLAQSIAKDFIKQALNFSIANVLGFAGKGAGAVTGKAGGASALAAPGGLSKLFGGARAGGGDVASGKSYLVGEKGPELFTPGLSGAITPNHILRSVKPPAVSQITTNNIAQPAPSIQFAPTVHVNANGGTHAQNADLGKQVTREMQTMFRHMMIEEMRRQRRPNGALT